jgi:hypothetical protein
MLRIWILLFTVDAKKIRQLLIRQYNLQRLLKRLFLVRMSVSGIGKSETWEQVIE